MTAEALLSAFEHPAALAAAASARRNELFGAAVVVRPDAPCSPPTTAARLRDGAFASLEHWPAASELREDDRLIVQVDPTPLERQHFVQWLHELADSPLRWSLAPFSRDAAGVHRLWCIAVARACLPATVRIEVRHDLVGLRLAQLALGFGADTLTGPLQPERKLPLAGVPRPTEATALGLHTMVRQTGLEPRDHA
jgi:hypothetical protein